MAAFLSQDKKLLEAYAEDKDVYAMIASEMFGYPYEECLEFYKEFSILDIDGKKVVAGNDKEYSYDITDEKNYIDLPGCYLLDTDKGQYAINQLNIGMQVKSDTGWLKIVNIERYNREADSDIDTFKVTFDNYC